MTLARMQGDWDALTDAERLVLRAMVAEGVLWKERAKKCAPVVVRALCFSGLTIRGARLAMEFWTEAAEELYGALIGLTQERNGRPALVQAAGKLGPPDGDAPAEPEFTECRLSPYGEWLTCTMMDHEGRSPP